MEGTLEEPPIKDSSQASPDKVLKGMFSSPCLELFNQSPLHHLRYFSLSVSSGMVA